MVGMGFQGSLRKDYCPIWKHAKLMKKSLSGKFVHLIIKRNAFLEAVFNIYCQE